MTSGYLVQVNLDGASECEVLPPLIEDTGEADDQALVDKMMQDIASGASRRIAAKKPRVPAEEEPPFCSICLSEITNIDVVFSLVMHVVH